MTTAQQEGKLELIEMKIARKTKPTIKLYFESQEQLKLYTDYIEELIANVKKKTIEELRQLLEPMLTEISEGRGAFSMDRLTHAENCIENMKSLAMKGLEVLKK